ncbi:hypothetical protein PAXRUDRAFT_149829, partial [Paxillus rubicundulus Ve08.2h10]
SIFEDTGVHPDGISIPWIHSLQHYHEMVQLFGAPNGISSSIVESKHICEVKKLWRKSNKHNALGQMLVTNQHLDKLAWYRADCLAKGECQYVSLIFVNL